VIQRKQIDKDHLSTLFLLNIVSGAIIFLTLTLASPFIAQFFKNGLVRPIIIASSLNFLIYPFATINNVLMQREMEFGKIAVRNIGAVMVYGVTAIVMAILGFGVWSLICGTILGNIAEVVLCWKLKPWRPSLRFDIQKFRELFHFGASYMGTRIVRFVAGNTDYLVVGRVLGASALGYYTFAYNLMTLPLRKIAFVIARVTFPAFSKVQDDNGRLRRGYLKIITAISLVIFPLLAGLYFVAPDFIKIVYGAKWTSSILPLQIMCIAGVLKSLSTAAVFSAKGRPDIALKLNLLDAGLITMAALIGARYGIIGVATGITAVTIALFPLKQYLNNSLIQLKTKDYLSALYPALRGTSVMVIFLVCFRRLVPMDNAVILLVTSILLSIFVYFGTLMITKTSELRELFGLALAAVKPFFLKIYRFIFLRKEAAKA